MGRSNVGGESTGSERAVYVIAEAGVNHNGDVRLAHELVGAAARSGADAVKFQTFSADKLVSSGASTTRYQKERGSASDQLSLLSSLMLSQEHWSELRDHAAEEGIEFLSTPFDLRSAEFLVDLGVPALKVSSGELTNLPFLRELASLGVPLLVSTGMGTDEEVGAAVEACSNAPQLALFHCVTAYPAPLDECNLRAIPAMAAKYGVPVGWSDHTLGELASLGAVALGARLLEKHLTLDTKMPGPDHAASLEPTAFENYVHKVRALETGLGDGKKVRQPSEQENAPLVRRSWHAATDLSVGAVLSNEDLLLLRPEGGASPSVDLVGRTVAKSVRAGAPVAHSDLEGVLE